MSGTRAWARAVVRVVEDVGIELVMGVSGVVGVGLGHGDMHVGVVSKC